MVPPDAMAAPSAAKTNQDIVPPSMDSKESMINQDDRELLDLGYKAVLARSWGSFDNFACSFSALYCIGGIRVSFYIALSAGGPAAMYVHPIRIASHAEPLFST